MSDALIDQFLETRYGRLLDGDTLRRLDGGIDRIEGLDAPELAHPSLGLAEEPLAREATRRAAQFLAQPGVERFVPDARTTYGRDLAEYRDPSGLTLSAELVGRGLAAPAGEQAQTAAALAHYQRKLAGLEPMDAEDLEIQRYKQAVAPLLRSRYHELPMKPRNEGAWSLFKRGLERGVDSVQLMGSGLAKLAGEATGVKALREFGEAGIAENQADIALNRAKHATFEDSWQDAGVTGVLEHAVEALGEQVPNLVTLLGTGGTGLVARGAAKYAAEKAITSAAVGALARTSASSAFQTGAGAAAVGLNTGETKLALDEADPDGDHNLEAVLGGTAKGALDLLSLGKLIGPAARATGLSQGAALTAMRQVPRHVLESAATEGGTEGVQSLIDQVLVSAKSGRDIDWKDVRESALVGGLTGGVFAGGSGALGVAMAPDNETLNPEIRDEPDFAVAGRTDADVLADGTGGAAVGGAGSPASDLESAPPEVPVPEPTAEAVQAPLIPVGVDIRRPEQRAEDEAVNQAAAGAPAPVGEPLPVVGATEAPRVDDTIPQQETHAAPERAEPQRNFENTALSENAELSTESVGNAVEETPEAADVVQHAGGRTFRPPLPERLTVTGAAKPKHPRGKFIRGPVDPQPTPAAEVPASGPGLGPLPSAEKPKATAHTSPPEGSSYETAAGALGARLQAIPYFQRYHPKALNTFRDWLVENVQAARPGLRTGALIKTLNKYTDLQLANRFETFLQERENRGHSSWAMTTADSAVPSTEVSRDPAKVAERWAVMEREDATLRDTAPQREVEAFLDRQAQEATERPRDVDNPIVPMAGFDENGEFEATDTTFGSLGTEDHAHGENHLSRGRVSRTRKTEAQWRRDVDEAAAEWDPAAAEAFAQDFGSLFGDEVEAGSVAEDLRRAARREAKNKREGERAAASAVVDLDRLDEDLAPRTASPEEALVAVRSLGLPDDALDVVASRRGVEYANVQVVARVPRARVAAITRRLLAGMTEQPRVVIHETLAQASAEGPLPFEEGVVAQIHRSADTLHIVLDQVESEAHLQEVLLHELKAHYGLYKLFGADFKRVMRGILARLGGEPGVRAMLERFGKADRLTAYEARLAKVEAAHGSEARQEVLMDEALAFVAETGQQLNVFERAVAFVRAWLRRAGLNKAGKLSDRDVLYLLHAGETRLRAGAVSRLSPFHGHAPGKMVGGEALDSATFRPTPRQLQAVQSTARGLVSGSSALAKALVMPLRSSWAQMVDLFTDERLLDGSKEAAKTVRTEAQKVASYFYTPPGVQGMPRQGVLTDIAHATRRFHAEMARIVNLAEAEDAKRGHKPTLRQRVTGTPSPSMTEAFVQLLEAQERGSDAGLGPVAQALRTYLDNMHAYANVRRMVKTPKRAFYFPQAHDHERIQAETEAYVQFLLTGNAGGAFTVTYDGGHVQGLNEASARELAQAMTAEHNHTEAQFPYAGSLKQRLLTDPAYQRAARDAGWSYADPNQVLEFYTASVIKAVEAEHTFGGFNRFNDRTLVRVLQETGFLLKTENVSAEDVQQAMAAARAQGYLRDAPAKTRDENGDLAQPEAQYDFYHPDKVGGELAAQLQQLPDGGKRAARFEKIRAGLMGNLGTDLDPKLRKAMQWVSVLQTVTVLALSTVSSLPELGVNLARSPDLKSAWQGLRAVARDFKGALDLAESLGLGQDGMAMVALMDSSQYKDLRGLPRRIVETFFYVNGQHFWTKMQRALALQIGIAAFRARAEAGDAEFFRDFGDTSVAPDSVKAWLEDMPLDTWHSDTQAQNPGAHPVLRALYQFVDGRVVTPNAAHAPVWMNDPRFMLVAQLKRFFYAYGTVITGGMMRETANRWQAAMARGDSKAAAAIQASVPYLVLGALTMPLAALAGDLKDQLKRKPERNQWDDPWRLLRHSGIFGPADLLVGAYDTESRFGKGEGFAQLLGPAVGHASTLVQYGPWSPEFVQRTTPVFGQTMPWLWDNWKRKARRERRREAAEDR